MKRDPEKTFKGRLALMTEDRDNFKHVAEKQIIRANNLYEESKAKDDRYLSYKHRVEHQLEWYRTHIQALVSKIPGGGR